MGDGGRQLEELIEMTVALRCFSTLQNMDRFNTTYRIIKRLTRYLKHVQTNLAKHQIFEFLF